jgi:GTPase SAR1 family protein
MVREIFLVFHSKSYLNDIVFVSRDTAGQERFRSITSKDDHHLYSIKLIFVFIGSYYRGADGVVIVYDVCTFF